MASDDGRVYYYKNGKLRSFSLYDTLNKQKKHMSQEEYDKNRERIKNRTFYQLWLPSQEYSRVMRMFDNDQLSEKEKNSVFVTKADINFKYEAVRSFKDSYLGFVIVRKSANDLDEIMNEL